MKYSWEKEYTQEEKDAARAEIIRRFSNTDLLTALIQKAIREAIIEHKMAGNPVAASVNGQIVIIQPEDIVIPDEPVFLEEWGEDLTLRFKKTALDQPTQAGYVEGPEEQGSPQE